MGEYTFSFVDANKRTFTANFNDTLFNYPACRNVLPENVCLEIIATIKKASGKKMAIVFGNCQTLRLKEFFLNNKIFSEEYLMLHIPYVGDYIVPKFVEYFQENFWSLCDLFISQRVKKDNKFTPVVATQKIPALLPETAKIIWIPNVFFNGYFPQDSKNFHNVGMDLHQSGLFPCGDKFVDAFLDGGGYRVSELVDFITAQNFISEEDVLKGVENSFNELKKREWACDIHMLDFVIDNYKRQQIFYSGSHPTQNVILELARRILKFMDISDTSFQNTDSLMREENSLIGQDIPIYPKVKEILGLKNTLDVFYANRYLPTEFGKFRANYVDFLVEYAKTCRKDKLILD